MRGVLRCASDCLPGDVPLSTTTCTLVYVPSFFWHCESHSEACKRQGCYRQQRFTQRSMMGRTMISPQGSRRSQTHYTHLTPDPCITHGMVEHPQAHTNLTHSMGMSCADKSPHSSPKPTVVAGVDNPCNLPNS